MFGNTAQANNLNFLEEGVKPPMMGQIKADFISKVYCLLSIQMVATWLMSYLFYANPQITNFVLTETGLLVASCLFTFVFLFLSWCYGKCHPWNYLILTGFTLCEAYSVSYVCLFYQSTSIMLAWGLTASIFIGLSAYVVITGKDFHFLGAGLFSCLWILIIGGLIQIIWLPNNQVLNTSMAVLGAMVASGYILYDTSELVKRMEPDDFVYACMNLYLDIIMLFLRLLELLGKRRD